MLTKSCSIIALILVAGNLNPASADIIGGIDVKEKDSVRKSTVGLYTPSAGGRGGALPRW